jgi:hypothetical protein
MISQCLMTFMSRRRDLSIYVQMLVMPFGVTVAFIYYVYPGPDLILLYGAIFGYSDHIWVKWIE